LSLVEEQRCPIVAVFPPVIIGFLPVVPSYLDILCDYWTPTVEYSWIQTLHGQFATALAWAPYSGPGHWPDADMLPIGYLGPRPGLDAARPAGLSHDERRMLLNFWSIIRSPLMMGGDLPHNDAWTTSLLTNPEVIAVNQHSIGNRPLITTNSIVTWTATPENEKGQYLAIFNLGDSARNVALEWNEVGLSPGKEYASRDLWERKDLGPATSLDLTLQPHACVLYRVSEGGKPFTDVLPHLPAGSGPLKNIPNHNPAPPPPSNGLIHYWNLDQAPGSTTAVDSIGGANVTLARTAAFSTSSEIGSGILNLPHDGLSKCSGVTTPADMLARRELTLSMWYKRACAYCAVETGQELGDDGEEIAIQAWADGNLYVDIGGNGASTDPHAGIPQHDTNWHLATLVFDGTLTGDANRVKLYLDGVQRTSGSFNRPVPASTTTVAQTFYIGATNCGQIHDAGSIDDVRVYDRAPSATEVSNLCKATYSGAGAVTEPVAVAQAEWRTLGDVSSFEKRADGVVIQAKAERLASRPFR
jgi:Concanavalin A-like lectin/glucanases superfamily/Alpha galactosidase C-terminal beta sandwich domain/Alpha galactosidase A